MENTQSVKDDAPVRGQAIAVVRSFLAALEARDLDGAQSLLGQDAVMVFPGGQKFADLAELAAWASGRYRKVAKRIDRVDAAGAHDGTVVVCRGTLYGVGPDGTPFTDIRFADWFLICDGKISRQEVWNDLAETLRR